MLSLIIIILLIIGSIITFFIKPKDEEGQPLSWFKWIRIGALAFTTIIAFSVSCKIVPVGHIGVIETLGKVNPQPRQSGMTFVFPPSTLKNMTIQLQSYTMSIAHDEGVKEGNDAIDVLTQDGVTVTLDMTVLFGLNPAKAPEIFRTIGIHYVEQVVRPNIRTSLRNCASNYTAVQLYEGTTRAKFVEEVQRELDTILSSKGVILDKVLLRNAILPPTIKSAIEDKLSAQQKAEKMVYIIQEEKQKAEQRIIEARGIAESQRIIQATLTTEYLQLEGIKAIGKVAEGQNNAVFVVPSDKSGLLLNLGK